MDFPDFYKKKFRTCGSPEQLKLGFPERERDQAARVSPKAPWLVPGHQAGAEGGWLGRGQGVD